MDLWIRSQDKSRLIKILTGVKYFKCCGDEHHIEDIDMEYTLGEYSTKERAIEILDEIQNFLAPRFIVSANSDNDCLENLFDKSTCGKAFPDDRLQIKNINRDCWVYEMPQE